MRLLLDTTYILPAIGVSVRKIPSDALVRLMREGHQVSISDISLFELSAKGAKLVATRKLAPERVARGIRAIIYNETVEIVPIYESTILLTAFRFRNILTDFIDCLILSSAVNRCSALVTEDDDLKHLKGRRECDELLMGMNPGFKIQALDEII